MSANGRAAEIAYWEIRAVEIGLREGASWLAILPANLESLKGMLSVMPRHKKRKEDLLCQAGDSEQEQEAALAVWEQEIEAKARNIREELTRGNVRENEDSCIPSDLRFKRTREGNLYIGAGNILASIKEAAWFFTGNSGMKRSLGNRLYVSPGKVIVYRYEERNRIGLKMADGRIESHVPPATIMGSFGPRKKPATINFPEAVNYPASLHFYLHIHPDVRMEDIRQYLEIAAELGLQGMHAARQGQFNVHRFYEPYQETKKQILYHLLASS